MSIKRFFDKNIIVSRLSAVSGNKKSFSTTATVEMAVQELDRNARVQLDLTEGRAWIGYFDIEDDESIRKGDMLRDADEVQYKVFEKTKKNYGINQHIEVIFIKYDE